MVMEELTGSAGQTYLLMEDGGGWSLALRWAMPQWYAWGLLTPGIAAVERRIGRGRPLGARLALQLPLGVGWTLLAIGMCLCVRPLIGTAWPASIGAFVLERFNWDLLIYAVIAGVIVAIARGLTAARALGKAKQAFPPGMRRF